MNECNIQRATKDLQAVVNHYGLDFIEMMRTMIQVLEINSKILLSEKDFGYILSENLDVMEKSSDHAKRMAQVAAHMYDTMYRYDLTFVDSFFCLIVLLRMTGSFMGIMPEDFKHAVMHFIDSDNLPSLPDHLVEGFHRTMQSS